MIGEDPTPETGGEPQTRPPPVSRETFPATPGHDVSRETPPPSRQAADLFGAALPRAHAYAALLCEEATVRGLIGPREVPRVWDRHLVNSAVISELVERGVDVCDLGSGAGLPGIPLALVRPDLTVTLVEPLLRRTRFLEEVVERLDLANVRVLRARAEELHGLSEFDVVTSRAVAPLDRLARWSLPLVRRGGAMLAIKGTSAAEEVARARKVLRRLGGAEPDVVRIGSPWTEPPLTVVRITRLS